MILIKIGASENKGNAQNAVDELFSQETNGKLSLIFADIKLVFNKRSSYLLTARVKGLRSR